MVRAVPAQIFTIGHSNHPIERFLALLRSGGIEALVDVRSVPSSRFCPQFRRGSLVEAMAAAGISYAWYGEMLGGKPKNRALWRDGAPDYAKIAAQPEFARKIDALAAEAARRAVAIMCAEKDPRDCHRSRLLGPPLIDRGIVLRHILADGSIEGHDELFSQPG
jgi:uncharacterized protein (DUF488 family)